MSVGGTVLASIPQPETRIVARRDLRWRMLTRNSTVAVALALNTSGFDCVFCPGMFR